MPESLQALVQRTYWLLLSVLLLISISSPAAADPITGTFDVHIFERYSYRTQQHEPFDATFRLRVTFDEQITHEIVSGDIVERFFGPPTLSPIPLPIAIPPPAWHPAIDSAVTNYSAGKLEAGTWWQNGLVEVGGENGFVDPFYHFEAQLSGNELGLTMRPHRGSPRGSVWGVDDARGSIGLE
jgi:hypothetical protein